MNTNYNLNDYDIYKSDNTETEAKSIMEKIKQAKAILEILPLNSLDNNLDNIKQIFGHSININKIEDNKIETNLQDIEITIQDTINFISQSIYSTNIKHWNKIEEYNKLNTPKKFGNYAYLTKDLVGDYPLFINGEIRIENDSETETKDIKSKNSQILIDNDILEFLKEENPELLKMIKKVEDNKYEIVWTIKICGTDKNIQDCDKFKNIEFQIEDFFKPIICLYQHYISQKDIQEQYKELIRLTACGFIKYAKDECKNQEEKAIQCINKILKKQTTGIKDITIDIIKDFIE